MGGVSGSAGDRRGGAALPRAVLCLVTLASTGCAGLFGSFDTAPNGLSRYDDGLRTLLAAGRYDSALALSGPERARAGDELLRLQIEGLVAHYAGEYERSNAALQRSAELADDRYTRSISKALLSAVSNDRALAYRPPGLERVLQHYYGILNYLEMGDLTGAAVEARRLGHRLDLLEAAGREGDWRELQAVLRRLTGAVFERAGEENDAAVAYRIADALRGGGSTESAEAAPENEAPADEASARESLGPGAPGPPPVTPPGSTRVADGERSAVPPDSAEVLVVVEQGFVAHRVERSANLVLWPDEIEAMRVREEPEGDEERAYRTSLTVAERTLGDGTGAESARAARRGAPAAARVRPEGRPHLLRVAWPVLAEEGSPGPTPRLVAAPGSTGEHALAASGPAWRADLSGALRQEFEGDLTRIVATSILRAVAKYSLAKALEEEVSEEDETAGEVVGLVANLGGALLERADTRSWNLLPGRLALVRLRLPAGTPYALELRREGRRAEERRVPLRTVTLRPGELRILSVRTWGPRGIRPGSGDDDRGRRASSEAAARSR